MNSERRTINSFQIASEFCEFVNNELLAVPEDLHFNSKEDFWNRFTALLDQTNVTLAGSATHNEAADVSLLNPRYALKALNARWGSLYSALYHESAIPHSAGLKTGQRYNVARGTRVISYAREFLDSAFPLTEGSHKDAVSYMIYFQNLMVTLADGSTVGLKTPSQFVAKSGPKSDPDAIVLRHSDIHVEIQFDRAGTNGAKDMASVQDILVEAPARTVLSCDAQTISEKCEILRNLQALASGKLKAKFQREGKNKTRRLHRNTDLTARDGSDYTVEGCNPAVLRMHASSACPAVSDSNGNPLPGAVVDAALFSLITRNQRGTNIELMASSQHAYELINPVIEMFQSHSDSDDLTIELLKDYQNDVKEDRQSADIPAQQLPWIRVAEEELRNTVTLATQNGAVLRAIHQHGGMPH